ncbi:male-enhanced antigen 1 [Esox lucius]|uniref:Male-enhanced antigen 1 n=1 Tax=Esox lucius TaxID=8010 RepID=A0AAY5K326_ESOLU|nr:male-enhanced antigen 1 [Esox lucius]XP_010894536.1 male-enhanced antigen 1 [Esox lucius]
MEVEIAFEMGPERILPNSEEELGQERPSDGGVAEVGGEWSGDEDEGGVGGEEEENGGYYYQPLNQDPDGLNGAPGDQPEDMPPVAEQLQAVQERIESMGLHLPQPPPEDSDAEEDPEAAAAQRSAASIPMDEDHVELVKRTMAAVALPTLAIPAWAQQISDDQWKDMVQQTLQTRQSSEGLRLERK